MSKENKGLTVISLFDGISVGQLALHELGIKVDDFYGSEVVKSAFYL